MSIDEAYQLVRFVIRKNMNGDITPSEFNLLIKSSQTEFLDFLLGSIEQQQYGRPVSRVALGNNQRVYQKLAPFINPPTTLTVTSGVAPYPTGYVHTVAMLTSDNKKIKWVQPDELHSYLEDVIDPISTNPVFLIQNGQFQFYPTSVVNPKISYVKEPAAPVWGYTLDGNSRPVYASGSSTNMSWGNTEQMEILSRVLQKVGINLQARAVEQYAREVKTQGQ